MRLIKKAKCKNQNEREKCKMQKEIPNSKFQIPNKLQ